MGELLGTVTPPYFQERGWKTGGLVSARVAAEFQALRSAMGDAICELTGTDSLDSVGT
jgi:hypothetical protein